MFSEPVEAEDDGVRHVDDAETGEFGVGLDLDLGNHIMGDCTRDERAVIDGEYRDWFGFGSKAKRVRTRKSLRDEGAGSAAINEGVGVDGLSSTSEAESERNDEVAGIE